MPQRFKLESPQVESLAAGLLDSNCAGTHQMTPQERLILTTLRKGGFIHMKEIVAAVEPPEQTGRLGR